MTAVSSVYDDRQTMGVTVAKQRVWRPSYDEHYSVIAALLSNNCIKETT
ncbi:MAG: hypothetical protein HXL36_07240 [Prevotellaceae bacterium]|nr:hypothetical protein [Prevotellaceae bacterium]